MKRIKTFEDYNNVDFNAKEPYYNITNYSKNLPFTFTSPTSDKEYKIDRGNVRKITNLGKSKFNITLYLGGMSSPISLYIDDIDNADIIRIEENNQEKRFYIKNLEEKDIIYQIIDDVKNKIKE
jgi:hypothetical protein